jgi:hypothetical protein
MAFKALTSYDAIWSLKYEQDVVFFSVKPILVNFLSLLIQPEKFANIIVLRQADTET